MPEPTTVELLRVPTLSGSDVVVEVVGRVAGDLAVVVSYAGPVLSLRTEAVLVTGDLDDWEACLDAIDEGDDTTWLDDGRTLSWAFALDHDDEDDEDDEDVDDEVDEDTWVLRLHDEPDSGDVLELVVDLDDDWLDEAYDLLEAVRAAYPAQGAGEADRG